MQCNFEERSDELYLARRRRKFLKIEYENLLECTKIGYFWKFLYHVSGLNLQALEFFFEKKIFSKKIIFYGHLCSYLDFLFSSF